MIFYFKAVGKAIEEQKPNALYKASRWGAHAIGRGPGTPESGIALFYLTIYRHSVNVVSCPNKTHLYFKLCQYNMYNAFMKSMCIPSYKHRKKKSGQLRDGNIDYVELSHASTTKNSCVFFHKITFRPRPSLQLNLVQGNPPKNKGLCRCHN